MPVTIVSPSAGAVKPHKHKRISRAELSASEIKPELKAFGRHIARRICKRRGVHIPAMTNDAFGQVLRTLKLKRGL